MFIFLDVLGLYRRHVSDLVLDYASAAAALLSVEVFAFPFFKANAEGKHPWLLIRINMIK